MARLPLEGVRVLDFTWVVAGPVATRILADQGAEVIKIERGDENAMSLLGPRRIGLQGDLHRNKRSAAINMATPRGVELARTSRRDQRPGDRQFLGARDAQLGDGLSRAW